MTQISVDQLTNLFTDVILYLYNLYSYNNCVKIIFDTTN